MITFLKRGLSTRPRLGALRVAEQSGQGDPDCSAVLPAPGDRAPTDQGRHDCDRRYAVLHYETLAELAALDRRVRDIERAGRRGTGRPGAGGEPDGSARVLTLVAGSVSGAGR